MNILVRQHWKGGAIFDLTCTDDNGAQFLIEVQRGRQKYFKQRAVFYASRLITSQAPKGRRNEWGYALTAVYLIALLGNPLPDYPAGQYLHDICLIDRNTKEIFYEELGYIIVELSIFVKNEEELETDLDKWLYLIKHLSQFNEMPDLFDKPIFEKLFAVAEYSNLTKQEKIMYDSSMKYKWDNKNVLDYEVNEGRERGMKEGLQQGLQQGLQEGIEQGNEQGLQKGLQQGKVEGRLEAFELIALKMKMQGYSAEFIKNVTNLSIAQIEAL